MKKSYVFIGLILLILLAGYPLSNELLQLQAVKNSKKAFQKTVIESNKSVNGSVVRSNPHWENLPESVVTPLDDKGFYPATLTSEQRNFTLEKLSGSTTRYRDFKGEWIILNFWATWCPPCRMEMPSLDQLDKHFSSDPIKVVTVNVQQSTETIRNFQSSYGFSLPVLLDKEGKVAKRYGATGLPETWIINPQGIPIGKLDGPLEWNKESILEIFETLLTSHK